MGCYRLSGDSRESAGHARDAPLHLLGMDKGPGAVLSITWAGLCRLIAQDDRACSPVSSPRTSQLRFSLRHPRGNDIASFSSARAQLTCWASSWPVVRLQPAGPQGRLGDPLVRGQGARAGKDEAHGERQRDRREHACGFRFAARSRGPSRIRDRRDEPDSDLTIESAVSADFAGESSKIEVARVGATVKGIYAARVDGPITDTLYRARWTVGGVNPGYTFAVAVGISSQGGRMAVFGKFTDAFVSVGGTDLSDHVESVTINYSATMLDASAMGDDAKFNLSGLKEWSMQFEFKQDYAAGSVDAVLPLIGGAAAALIVRPKKSTPVGAGNPNYSGIVVLASYNPASGAHGSLHTASATFQSAGTLSRAEG